MELLRLLVIDPDSGLRAQLQSGHRAGIEVTVHPPPWPSSPGDAAVGHDVVLVGVDSALGLQTLSDLCSTPGAPPVVGIAGHGFDGKSLEHVLLLAEVRGAAATIMKPVTVDEIAVAVWAVTVRRQPRELKRA